MAVNIGGCKSPIAYLHRKTLSVKQLKGRKCLNKQCHHLKKYQCHSYWLQREIKKSKKENEAIEIWLFFYAKKSKNI